MYRVCVCLPFHSAVAGAEEAKLLGASSMSHLTGAMKHTTREKPTAYDVDFEDYVHS